MSTLSDDRNSDTSPRNDIENLPNATENVSVNDPSVAVEMRELAEQVEMAEIAHIVTSDDDDDHHHRHKDHPVSSLDAAHEHFTSHEFGNTNLQLLDFHGLDGRQLVALRKRPRQFFIGDVLYREKDARKVTWDELFFDLLFVAIVGQIAGMLHLPGKIDWLSINDFCLVFIIIWSSWLNISIYLNRFGYPELPYRLGLYFSMILCLGLGLNGKNAFNEDPAKNTSNIFVVTYLILRSLIMLVYCTHAYSVREFAPFILSTSVFPIVAAIPWLVSVFVPLEVTNGLWIRRGLWWSSYFLDNSLIMFSLMISKLYRFNYRLGVNIEHLSERMGLFIIIILGEMVVSIVFDSYEPYFSMQYLDICLGLVIAITWQWLYFNLLDAHGSKSTHGLRKSVFRGIFWNLLHSPLSMCLVIAGVGIGILVQNDNQRTSLETFEEEYGHANVRWLVCGGLACASLITTLLGMTFSSMEKDIPWGAMVREWFHHPKSDASSELEMAGKSASNSDPHFDSNQTGTKQSGSNSSGKQSDSNQSTSAPTGRRKLFARHDSTRVLPKCVRQAAPEKIPEGYELIPRFPKWFRLCIRASMIVVYCLIGAFGEHLPIAGFLAVIATINVAEVMLEEIGKEPCNYKLMSFFRVLQRYPIVPQALTAGSLFAVGDILAQTLWNKQESKFDGVRTARLAFFGTFIAGPSTFAWYRILEKHVVASSALKTTVSRVLVDQLIFAPTFIGVFFAVTGLLQGQNAATIKTKIQSSYFDTLKANYVIWPSVQMVNFYFVPLHLRLAFVNVVAIGWNGYLSTKLQIVPT